MSNTADRAKALAYFTGMGWTPAQAAGIVANLVAESDLNPAAVGDGGSAYGLAQWHPDRQAGFAALMGKPIQGSTLEDQLCWVHAELQGTEKAAGDALRACTTATEAGACVSRLYERPADHDGEATRRGALAETLMQSQPQPAPAPGTSGDAVIVPPQPEISTMGALAIPFLTTILPSVIGLFAPKVQAQITKATGAGPDVAAAFLQSLMAQVGSVAAIPVVDQASAIQAVAKVTADPAAVSAVEAHALDYLDKLSPMIDKLAAAETAKDAASVAGMNAAAVRAQGEKWDMTRVLVMFAGATASLLVLALTAAIIYQSVWKGSIDTGLIGIAGPLMAIAMGVWREIFAYRFDGSKNSETQTALATAITDASKRATT